MTAAEIYVVHGSALTVRIESMIPAVERDTLMRSRL